MTPDEPQQPSQAPDSTLEYGAPEATSSQPAQAPAAHHRNSGKAVAALVLGIVGLLIFPIVCSTLAIIFGVMGRNEIDRDPSLSGRGMATAGLVMGIIGIVWGVIVIAVIAGS